MSFSSKTVPDLSSNVLKLSFMRPSLRAAEKCKVVKEDKNKLNITFQLPEGALKLINDAMNSSKNSTLPKKESNLFSLNKIPRGVRLSYGGFNLETESQMLRKEINIDEVEEVYDPTDDYSVSVEEMKDFAMKNRSKFIGKRQHSDAIAENRSEIKTEKIKRKK